MKKYGLITIHDTQNYGSLLQTYGLYKAINIITNSIELIDYKNDAIATRETSFSLKECHGPKGLIKHFLWHPDMKKRYDAFWDFMKSNMKISKEYNRNNISCANDEFDSFIIGSDIVWGMEITGNDFTYFLDFANDSKEKIAFSASIGNKWGNEVIPNIQKLLLRFKYISVREEQAVKWLKEVGIENVENTCDPTMLWDGDEWKQYIDDSITPHDKYVLIYMADAQKKNIKDAIKYAKANNFSVYYVNFYSKVYGTKSIKPYSVGQWLSLIANAECVFTSSYHGLMFSMYFHKQLFYYNNVYKSRMSSLCYELGIEFREGIDSNLMTNREIDYSIVDEKIEKKRRYAWMLLHRWIKED